MRRALIDRLVRLEELRGSSVDDARFLREELNARLEAFRKVNVQKYTAAEQAIADTFQQWFSATFEPIPPETICLEDRLGCFRARTLEYLPVWPDKEEFDAWWNKTYPDRSQSDVYEKGISEGTTRMFDQMYYEAVCGLVPLDKRRYFIDPDNWVVWPRRDDAGRPTRIYLLKFISQPKGDVLKRARALAKEWARRDRESRFMRVTTAVLTDTPLEYIRRTAGGPSSSLSA